MESLARLNWSSKKVVLPLLGVLAVGAGSTFALADNSPAAIRAQPAAPSGDVSGLVSSVQPAVVSITVEQLARTSADSDEASPFDFFGGGGRRRRGPSPHVGKLVGAGSGFVFDDKGHVVTNAHVVDDASIVKVKLSDERELKAKVLGRDERLDVAVLEIQGATGLPHVSLGSSAGLKVGEPVVAIGNAFGLGGTVTSGIVSAKSRTIGAGPYDDFIQTDASINPGNSGGPLFDLKGQVVGMNTAINPSGQGIGFAIPSDAIREVLPQLLERGHVSRGRLGAQIQSIDEPLAKALGLGDTRGALVGDLENNGPAAKAGLREGDVIVAIDGHPVVHAHDLPRMIGAHAPGSKVALEAKRGSGNVNVSVTLGELQDEKEAKPVQQAPASSGSLGLRLGNANGAGALVEDVSEAGPAAGVLVPGDVITEVDHQPVKTAADAKAKLQRATNDKPLLLRVEHEGLARWVAIDRKAG